MRTSAPARACGCNEIWRALIVRVEDSDARSGIDGAIEEKPLGGEVLLHRLVIVEVVAREIGEDGDVERNAESAALVESRGSRLR